MLQHFTHPLVCIAYLAAIVGNFTGLITSTNWRIVFIQSFILMIIDVIVHRENHDGSLPEPPWMTFAWMTTLMYLAAMTKLIAANWQLGIIFFCQMWWDNSWHSVFYHRPQGKPTTHTDKWWVRWGALAAAAAAIAIPHLS